VDRNPYLKPTFETQRPRWDKDKIVCLNMSFFHHVALPLFLRHLDPQVIAAITYGVLLNRVYLYLDWQRLSRVAQAAGAEFIWSSERETGRARAMKPATRPPVISGRVPQIKVDELVVPFTDPSLVRILFDGSTPRAIVDSMITLMTTLPLDETDRPQTP
jgi:hypothetical protein